MEFVRFVSFEKSAAALFTEADILELELQLLLDPEAAISFHAPAVCASCGGHSRAVASAAALASFNTSLLQTKEFSSSTPAKNVQGDLTATQGKQLAKLVQQELP